MTLDSANQIYVAKKFQVNKQFQTGLQEHFGAEAESVDFSDDAARLAINKWVADSTQQKILDFLPKGP